VGLVGPVLYWLTATRFARRRVDQDGVQTISNLEQT
jgi:hypothetical protein